ncbi:MAG TPA: PAS domain-containing protein, partial [Polyangia bacterium]|nr:PAS domain-containing protein [Polyangia bacterium]
MEQLRGSDERFRTILENAPINIAVYSHDYRLLYVNPALAAMCPRDPSELVGKHADELWPAIVADPLKLHGARAIASGERQTYEVVTEQPGCPR